MNLPSHLPLTLVTALALTAGAASAQLPEVARTPFRFEGQARSSFELYGVSGRQPLRPASSARLMLNSKVTLFGSIEMGVDLLASTEGSFAAGTAAGPGRQQLNQIGLSPRWSWGRAYLGSFSDSYSPLTWSGTQVEGAGFNINPGLLRFAAFGGRSQRAVQAGATYGAYDRTMFGGRLGIGRGSKDGEDGTFLDLIFLRASDDASSLPPPVRPEDEPPPDLFADTLPAPVNPFAVTPQDNAVLAAAGGLRLLGGALRLSGELGGSLHTRDKRAAALDAETADRYPSLLRHFLTPRLGTTGDYAYSTGAQVHVDRLPGATDRSPRSLDLSAEYRYVGPGYASLGVASLLPDQRAVEVRSRLRFRSWMLSLTGLRQGDNLIGQKLATTTRMRLTGNFVVRPTRRWTASFRGARLTMGNNASDPQRVLDYTNSIVGTSQTFILSRRGLFRRAALRYAFRSSGDQGARAASSDLSAHSVSVQTVLYPASKLAVTPSLGLVESRAGGRGWSTRETYGLAAQYAMMDGRWSTSGSVSNATLENASSIQATLSSRFRVTGRDAVALRLRTRRLSYDLGLRPNSEEHTMTLEIRHRL